MKKLLAFLIMLLVSVTAILIMLSLTSCTSGVLADLMISTIYPAPTRPVITSTDTPEAYPVPEEIQAYPAPVVAPVADKCEVSTGQKSGLLNMRSCAGNSCSVIAILHEGDKLIVLDGGTWLHVLANDQAGYVLGRYCK